MFHFNSNQRKDKVYQLVLSIGMFLFLMGTPSAQDVLPLPGSPVAGSCSHRNFELRVDFNVTYGYGACLDHQGIPYQKALKMDIYHPINSSAIDKPALLLIHGAVFGDETQHNKNEDHVTRAARYFTTLGVVCFAINFRVRGFDPYCEGDNEFQRAQRSSFVDAKAAVRWIKAHAVQMGIDPNRVAAYGGSSGASSAMMLAITDPLDFATDFVGGQIPATNHPYEDPRIHAALEFWGTCFEGWYGNPPELWLVDFSYAFDSEDAPFMITHGTADTVIPFSHAEQIEALCFLNGIYFRFYAIDGAGHGQWNAKAGDPPQGLNQLVRLFLRDDLGWNLL